MRRKKWRFHFYPRRKLSLRPGIVIDNEAQDLIGQGKELKASKPRKEDIVQE